MFEVKITIDAPVLAQAINNLAAALSGATPQQTTTQTQANVTTHQTTSPQAVQQEAPTPQQTVGYPTQAPQQQAPVNPTQAGGYVDPAQTAVQAAPMAGQTPVYPSNVPAPASTPQQAYAGPVSAPAQNMAPPSGVPLAQPPQYTIDQIQKAGATLMDAGRVNDLMNLLHSFGVSAITELKPELMGAFATALRGLGAKI